MPMVADISVVSEVQLKSVTEVLNSMIGDSATSRTCDSR